MVMASSAASQRRIRFNVRADEKLTAFVELESAIRDRNELA